MKLLFIIITNYTSLDLRKNIFKLREFIKENYNDCIVDYACVSSCNDFNTYEDIITFKYKMINKKNNLIKCVILFQNIKMI
jgi:hypothetical protein